MNWKLAPLLVSLAVASTTPAVAQRGSRPVHLLPPTSDTAAADSVSGGRSADGNSPRGAQRLTSEASGQRPVILLTGYWPPTNEMVRRFSQDPAKNPGGWVGDNWNSSGYDVVSFFPEFANPNCTSCGKGMGDLEVDYQDTTSDFAAITSQLKPIAIITFSRGFPGTSWEVESNQYNRTAWINDFVPPRQPNPSPPDATVASGAIRYTALPARDIVDAVDASGVAVNPFICQSADGGGFLSEYIAYLGVTYQALNNDPMGADWCVAAGHIHVGTDVSWPVASDAVDVTLESLIDYVDGVLACPPMQPYCAGAPNSVGFGAQLSAIRNPSISNGRLLLIAQRVPAGTSGITFYGPTQNMGTIGNGTLCVGGTLRRLPQISTANNARWMRFRLNYAIAPLGAGGGTVTPGSTWNFQTWYRDAGAGVGSNATNALQITFCP